MVKARAGIRCTVFGESSAFKARRDDEGLAGLSRGAQTLPGTSRAVESVGATGVSPVSARALKARGTETSTRDITAIQAMLGRPLRAKSDVAVTCPLELPAVIRVPPVLDDGTPFPTTYWLTCPLAVRRISKLESSGIMRFLGEQVDVTGADAAYAVERQAGLTGEEVHIPTGGVGGAHGGIKCLHARYAYWLAGGDDPAGAEAARRIGSSDCSAPCVTDSGVRVCRSGKVEALGAAR